MRIAFDARYLAYPVLRGMDRYTIGLVRELAHRGKDITLFHRSRQPLNPRHIADLPCKVVGLDDRGGLYWEQVAVPLALWRGKYDLFHAPAERGIPLTAPCPVVMTIFSLTEYSYVDLIKRGMLTGSLRDYMGYDAKWSIWSLYWRAQPLRADHIFTPSEFSRDEIVRFLRIPKHRVSVTPYAVHEQFQRAANPAIVRDATLKRLGVRKPYLIYVGGYEPHKNVMGLLESFALMRSALPELFLVIVGSKFIPNSVRQKAESLGLLSDSSVVFLLDITEDLTDLYDGAELFITLSWRETFCAGTAGLEAMTRGLPVVANIWGSAPEVVDGAGRLIDVRDPRAASDAVLELLRSSDRDAISKRAKAIASQFSWTRTVDQTERIYSSLVKHT